MPEPATKSAANPKDDVAVGLIEGPPEEEFWEKYNKRLEFPLSTVSAVLIHVLIGAVILLGIFALMNRDGDKSSVPVKLVDLAGLDDGGMGSAGSGGIDDPLVRAPNDPAKAAIASLPDPNKLPEIKESLKQTIKYLDPTGNLPISNENAAAYASLEESVRNKLLGARQGQGKQGGEGYDGSAGKGPGGSGADSTLGRNMRWVLRFKVSGGRDYLNQLREMGARILVPVPNSADCYFFDDLNNPRPRLATDSDLKALADQIKFSDARRDAVQGVAGALGLDFTPKTFWAFFPKGLESDLARKETGYRNKRSEDIEETIFRVTVRGGNYEIVVDDQKMKR
jgi:hypothetical protein